MTGRRILLSDFGDASQGPLGESPTGITRWTDADAFIADPDAGTDEKGALFRLLATWWPYSWAAKKSRVSPCEESGLPEMMISSSRIE